MLIYDIMISWVLKINSDLLISFIFFCEQNICNCFSQNLNEMLLTSTKRSQICEVPILYLNDWKNGINLWNYQTLLKMLEEWKLRIHKFDHLTVCTFVVVHFQNLPLSCRFSAVTNCKSEWKLLVQTMFTLLNSILKSDWSGAWLLLPIDDPRRLYTHV